MTAWQPPLRDDLRGAEPYGAPQLQVPVQLHVNENPYPVPAVVVEDIAASLARTAGALNRYPDREAVALRTDLAAYLAADTGVALDATRVWAANGSNEIMHQVFLAFGGPGRSALGFHPTYSMYPEYARDTFTRWRSRPRRFAVDGDRLDCALDLDDALDHIARTAPGLVVIASPNNPTGTAVSADELAAICAAAPGVVVVDEAYGEFRRAGTPSAVSLLERFPNLLVTRTMSKAFSFAGVRLGYVAAAPALIDALRIVRLPYHLSTVTQEVARAGLRHADAMLAGVAELRRERDRTVTWLRRHDFVVADSDANFAFFGPLTDRHAVWRGLVDRGVIIREVGPDGWLRASIGTAAEMAAFRAALLAVTGRGEAPTPADTTAG